MIDVAPSEAATWTIAAASTAGVIIRPWRIPEAVWAATGAAVLLIAGLISPSASLGAIAKGTDVYLFLTGMMLIAELARREGLFDYLAAIAAARADGSPTKLFTLIFIVGTVVTIFLSNDATAVVLTPAVYAAAKAAKVQPMPYVLICAFIANAASFGLPISNPANLVIFGDHMPDLLTWISSFALPSLLCIVVTYAALRWTQKAALIGSTETRIHVPTLSQSGRFAAVGIAATAIALLAASAIGLQLGWPTCVAALLTLAVVSVNTRSFPTDVIGNVSWSVLPLVAGLFVLVESLDKTGVITALSDFLHRAAHANPQHTVWGAGAGIALLSNVINNLPAGLIAGEASRAADVPEAVRSAILIGVDVGPNLSVTGSLATILWLTALRREGLDMSVWEFLKLGLIVMPTALIAALVCL
jgi:arsenical pump membrane protein